MSDGIGCGIIVIEASSLFFANLVLLELFVVVVVVVTSFSDMLSSFLNSVQFLVTCPASVVNCFPVFGSAILATTTLIASSSYVTPNSFDGKIITSPLYICLWVQGKREHNKVHLWICSDRHCPLYWHTD